MAYNMSVKDGLLLFTINRPDIRNAINSEVMRGFKEMVNKVVSDQTIRYVAITGAGERAFCSGGDLTEFHTLKTEAESYEMLSKMAKILYSIATLPVPVIALVNGSAVGGGCEIATACDYRLVSTTAKCGFIQGTLAITSGWGGGTWAFEKMERQDHVLKFLSEAAQLPALELKKIGWATDVFDGDKMEALQYFTRKMDLVQPSVLRAYKKMSIMKWEQSKVYHRILEEVRQCSILWEDDEHEKAVQKFLSRKK